jgi:hypothetical protein
VAISTLAKSSIGTFDKFNKTSAGNASVANAVFLMGGAYVNTTGYSTSTDGITWTLRSNNGMGSSNGVTKVGSYYVSCNSGGYLSHLADPIAGTSIYNASVYLGNIGVNNTFRAAFYQNNMWTWWGDYGWAMNNLVVPNGSAVNTTGVAFGNGVWVIIRGGTIYSQSTTTDFPAVATYTSRTSPITAPTVLAFGNGLFVAGGQNGIATSTDGTTWTLRSSAGSADYSLGKIFFAGGLWFAVRNTGSSNLYTSPDAITWTSRSPVFTSSVLIAAAFGNGNYVVMSNAGQLWSSPDGVTWTSRTNPQAGNNWWNNQSAHSTIYFG